MKLQLFLKFKGRCLNGQYQHMKWSSSRYFPLNFYITKRTKSVNVTENCDNIKPFSSIPGPFRLPLIGSMLPYKLGIKKLDNYHLGLFELYQKYGPVVREDLGSQTIIHIFNPDDFKRIYESDGKTPFIPPLQETTQKYREEKDMSPGLGNINGEEWYRLRHAVQQMMLRPKEVTHYLPLQDKVAIQAVDRLSQQVGENGIISDLHVTVGKWILESAGMICFERSLGSFAGGFEEERATNLVKANREIFHLSGELKFSLRLYRYMKTPKYSRLHNLEDYFYGLSMEFIEETITQINLLKNMNKLEDKKFNFLTYLLSRQDLSRKDVMTITLSLFSDGLSTTAPTFLGNMHCLALNPDIQEKVYEEIQNNVKINGPITVQILNKMHYLKAFVKEVFRFYPVGETVQRLTQKDLILNGYNIPAGTYIDINPYIWLRSEKYFPEPNVIRPERWLRKDGNPLVHPYVLTPFSIGTRMCAGRRFAEQDLYLGLCRLLLKYRLESVNSQPPQQEWKTLLRPCLPIPIRFISRN
ncbi:unnamed protein product, partial [Meganyctiphanes norvegica]